LRCLSSADRIFAETTQGAKHGNRLPDFAPQFIAKCLVRQGKAIGSSRRTTLGSCYSAGYARVWNFDRDRQSHAGGRMGAISDLKELQEGASPSVPISQEDLHLAWRSTERSAFIWTCKRLPV
jgi:hypothetical protein